MTEHALKIRQHYVYLLDALDTKYSALLDQLFAANVRISAAAELGLKFICFRLQPGEKVWTGICFIFLIFIS